MDDFIFGTFSTNESRIAHLTQTRGGITHAHGRSPRTPRDPLPDQPIQIELTVGPSYPFDRAWVHFHHVTAADGGRRGAGERAACANRSRAAGEAVRAVFAR